jgi:hypothetical protein
MARVDQGSPQDKVIRSRPPPLRRAAGRWPWPGSRRLGMRAASARAARRSTRRIAADGDHRDCVGQSLPSAIRSADRPRCMRAHRHRCAARLIARPSGVCVCGWRRARPRCAAASTDCHARCGRFLGRIRSAAASIRETGFFRDSDVTGASVPRYESRHVRLLRGAANVAGNSKPPRPVAGTGAGWPVRVRKRGRSRRR